jgi:16S rRNA (uracil1498-N3)-methyltransferase
LADRPGLMNIERSKLRVYISDAELDGDTVNFSASNSRYLRKVLRIRIGDKLGVFHAGSEHLVLVAQFGGGSVFGVILESITRQDKNRENSLTLAFCCVRPGPVEQILRHGTELGVTNFVPVLSHRSTRRPIEMKRRWLRILASAASQSDKSDVPNIDDPVEFDAFLDSSQENALKILLSRSTEAPTLNFLLSHYNPSHVVILVGPEGGLTPDEEAAALKSGFLQAGLGSYTLRSETAALLGAGVCSLWFLENR